MDIEDSVADIKESITDNYYYGIDASEKACIKKLVQILERINMDFNEFILLFEMNKKGLMKEFPNDMKKYKNPL
ncbi:hypothetical protein RhiirA4_479252 [Rhizophagus irregularis]|uniref:Uncharacterized protein n=1 Tax=Rhizophagus irregularis TaxID=588596 RepID=A0A2I1HG58_9GLOM|nr:hypothetical protein RhiirA4_479252 [Rhizophagus irregularis]